MVVAGLTRGEAWATSWRRVQADRWVEVYNLIRDWEPGSLVVTKIKAHRSQSILSQLPLVERRWWWGNHYADKWAKRGAALHRASPHEVAAARTCRSTQAAVAKWAATTICDDAHEHPWQREGRRWEPFRALEGRTMATRRKHELHVEGGVLRCLVCDQWAFTEYSRRRLRSLPCSGTLQSRLEKVGGAEGRQHCLVRSSPVACGGLPLLWCAVCGA